MKIVNTDISGCVIIEPEIYKDDRGFFFETFQQSQFHSKVSPSIKFVQDNFSQSKKNVLRGMHFQKTKPQGKLVRVTLGCVFDVAVDLRKDSKTYKSWVGLELSEKNNLQLYIPPGCAHGFLTLSEKANFEYKCTEYYFPEDEGCLRWDDPDINISWPASKNLIISKKDRDSSFFKDIAF